MIVSMDLVEVDHRLKSLEKFVEIRKTFPKNTVPVIKTPTQKNVVEEDFD